MTSSIFYTCNPPPFLSPAQPLFLILSFLFIFFPPPADEEHVSCLSRPAGFTEESGGSGCSADVWFCWSRFPTSPSHSSPVLARLLKTDLVVTGVRGPGERPRQDYSWMFFTFLFICIFFFIRLFLVRVLSGIEYPDTPGEIVTSCPLLLFVFSSPSPCDWAE